MLALKTEEGAMAPGTRGMQLQKPEQVRKQILPYRLRGAAQHRWHLDLSPGKLTPGFWPPELCENKFVLL